MKEAFLFTVLLCSRSLGHRESKDGRADLARGNQICVKLSDLFLSLSLFPSPPPLLFSSNSFTVEITISIDRDREIFLFLLYRGMIVCYDIADDRKESLGRSVYFLQFAFDCASKMQEWDSVILRKKKSMLFKIYWPFLFRSINLNKKSQK